MASSQQKRLALLLTAAASFLLVSGLLSYRAVSSVKADIREVESRADEIVVDDDALIELAYGQTVSSLADDLNVRPESISVQQTGDFICLSVKVDHFFYSEIVVFELESDGLIRSERC
jgi:hypothetical protein